MECVDPELSGIAHASNAHADCRPSPLMKNDMRNQTRIGQRGHNMLPTGIEEVDLLAEPALDMRWSWNHATYRKRAVQKGAKSAQLVASRRTLDREWSPLRLGQAHITIDGEQHAFEVEVCLGALDPEAVRVDLYADGVEDAAPVRQETMRVRHLRGSLNGSHCRGTVSAVRPPADYTPRAIPRRAGIALPLEDARISWQR
jgi:hypothetical protein